MPINDWARVDAGIMHDFHQGWTVELRRVLNAGGLPPGYFAMIAEPDAGLAPDHIAKGSGTTTLFNEAPHERVIYARRANRITIHRSLDRVVATIKFISPGDKAIRTPWPRSFIRPLVSCRMASTW